MYIGAQFAALGSNLLGPDMPGPNLLHQGPNLLQKITMDPMCRTRGPICRGPIRRNPSCRKKSQFAQFAAKSHNGPNLLHYGPNLPGTDFPGPKLLLKIQWAPFAAPGAQFTGAQFAGA